MESVDAHRVQRIGLGKGDCRLNRGLSLRIRCCRERHELHHERVTQATGTASEGPKHQKQGRTAQHDIHNAPSTNAATLCDLRHGGCPQTKMHAGFWGSRAEQCASGGAFVYADSVSLPLLSIRPAAQASLHQRFSQLQNSGAISAVDPRR
jgi:hypothetical protein